MEKRNRAFFLSKAEINVHMWGFLIKNGQKTIETAENSLMFHCNGLAFLSQRSHQLLVRRIQKNLFMAIIYSSPSGMAYDLYLTGSLYPPRTLYPPFPVLSCLCKQCRRDLQAQSHKNRWRGSCLCVLSLLQRLYLKQERNRRASCLGAGTVFCKS